MVKEDVIKVIERMEQENPSLDEIMYHLSILNGCDEGMKDVADGKVLTTEELKASLRRS